MIEPNYESGVNENTITCTVTKDIMKLDKVIGLIRLSEEYKGILNLTNFGHVCLKAKNKILAGSVQFAYHLERGEVDVSADICESLGIVVGNTLEISPIYAKDTVPVSDIDLIRVFPLNADKEDKRDYSTELVLSCLLYKSITLNSEIVILDVKEGVIIKKRKFKIIRVSPPGYEYYLISPDTVLNIVNDTQNTKKLGFARIAGYKDVLQRIYDLVILPLRRRDLFEVMNLQPIRGILLHGLPGTGKAMIAKATAEEANKAVPEDRKVNYYAISAPEIASKYFGESEKKLRLLFEKDKLHPPAIIFIDEIDAIAPKREEISGEVEKRIVSQLLSSITEIDPKIPVVVIAATNLPNSIDDALRRPGRLDVEIEIKPPTFEDRKQILNLFLEKTPLQSDVNIETLAQKSHGYVGADIKALCNEAGLTAIVDYVNKEREGVQANLTINAEHFKQALTGIEPSSLREFMFEKPSVHWKELGGLEDIINQIKDALEFPLAKASEYEKNGFKPIRGILLYGPPGTGKTMIAKIIATGLQYNFIAISGPQLLNKYVGESESAIRNVFRKARTAEPCIIFIDEIDALCSSRERVNSDSVNVVGQLLTEMDGLKNLNNVIVIGTTNRPDLLDKALLRPGRLSKKILIPLPNRKDIIKIFKIYLEKVKHTITALQFDELAYRAEIEKLAGADIYEILRDAFTFALKISNTEPIITYDHIVKAIDHTLSSRRKAKENQLSNDDRTEYD